MAEDAKASLLDAARARNRKQGPQCGVAISLTASPLADQLRDLLAALATREIRFSVAAEVCKEQGLDLTADTLSRHTRQKCSCVA